MIRLTDKPLTCHGVSCQNRGPDATEPADLLVNKELPCEKEDGQAAQHERRRMKRAQGQEKLEHLIQQFLASK